MSAWRRRPTMPAPGGWKNGSAAVVWCCGADKRSGVRLKSDSNQTAPRTIDGESIRPFRRKDIIVMSRRVVILGAVAVGLSAALPAFSAPALAAPKRGRLMQAL